MRIFIVSLKKQRVLSDNLEFYRDFKCNYNYSLNVYFANSCKGGPQK